MKAVILAAGRGSRMNAMTDAKPKSLVEMNGVPLIARAARALRAGGVTELGIVAGYRAEMLADYADHVFMNQAWSSTGIFHSLSMAAPWLDRQACLISYSDIFYSSRLVANMLAAEGDIVIAYDRHAVALWSQRFEDPLLDLERFSLDRRGCVQQIGGRAATLAEIEGQYMGLLKFTPAGWHKIEAMQRELAPEAGASVDMTTLLASMIAAGQDVVAVPNDDPWGEIDCPSDVALYQRLYPNL